MKLRILSIDGGGTRGIIPATILSCIQDDYNKSPMELFDLFAGTSTGGIICIGLAAGLPPDKLVDLYLNKSKEIFFEPWLDELTPADEYVQAGYSNARLYEIMEDLVGEKTLGDLHNDAAFGGSGKRLMITTFDLAPDDASDRNKNYRPHVLHSSFMQCAKVKLKDLALMTSAGPTYFPIVQQRYVDGGVALNNPAMAAVTFAINKHKNGDGYLYEDGGKSKGLGLTTDDLQLFSLSTGTGNINRIDPSVVKKGNWGKIHWIKYLPDLLTESNMQSTMYYIKQILEDEQFHRVELFFNDPDAPAILKEKPVGMDAKEDVILKAMHQFAKDTYLKQRDKIAAFLNLEPVTSKVFHQV
ncbi:MAG: Patatin [Flavisolibacter sp.]|jgi:patatin-like phospholipase/acyl hydrolase|nr:Patatin [Flavisolibacter sp.]